MVPARTAVGRRASWTAVAACAAAVLIARSPLQAQAPRLDLVFHDGRVTVRAEGVTARQVLEAWALKGHTRLVNAERLGSRRVTLHLDAVPESEALARIFESAAGYVARRRTGSDGPSDFAVIIVSASATPNAVAGTTDPETASAAPPIEELPADPPVGTAAAEEVESRPTAEETNGREPDARPDSRLVGTRNADAGTPVDQLDSGRPAGTRPGLPSTVPAAPPAGVIAAPKGSGTPVPDANGRPPKRP
jgi:hypothetical protein